MTVNELRAALDKMVAERPECGEMEVCSMHTGEYNSEDDVNAVVVEPANRWDPERIMLRGY